jgi:hypothetical protein
MKELEILIRKWMVALKNLGSSFLPSVFISIIHRKLKKTSLRIPDESKDREEVLQINIFSLFPPVNKNLIDDEFAPCRSKKANK